MEQIGARPDSPVTALTEVITAVRRLLAGETVTVAGGPSSCTTSGSMPSPSRCHRCSPACAGRSRWRPPVVRRRHHPHRAHRSVRGAQSARHRRTGGAVRRRRVHRASRSTTTVMPRGRRSPRSSSKSRPRIERRAAVGAFYDDLVALVKQGVEPSPPPPTSGGWNSARSARPKTSSPTSQRSAQPERRRCRSSRRPFRDEALAQIDRITRDVVRD